MHEEVERLLILFDLHRLFFGFLHLVAESGLEDQGIAAKERFMYPERDGFESDVDCNYLNPAVARSFSVYGVMKGVQRLYLHQITA